MARLGKELNFTLKDLGGEKKSYAVFAMNTADNLHVLHEVLRPVIKLLIGLGKSKDDEAKQLDGLASALDFFDYPTIKLLATKLLTPFVVDDEEYGGPYQCDYFRDNPDELYIAIYHALVANYPKVFLKLRGLVAASGLAEKAKAAFMSKIA